MSSIAQVTELNVTADHMRDHHSMLNVTAFSVTQKRQHVEDEEVACSSAHCQPTMRT